MILLLLINIPKNMFFFSQLINFQILGRRYMRHWNIIVADADEIIKRLSWLHSRHWFCHIILMSKYPCNTVISILVTTARSSDTLLITRTKSSQLTRWVSSTGWPTISKVVSMHMSFNIVRVWFTPYFALVSTLHLRSASNISLRNSIWRYPTLS